MIEDLDLFTSGEFSVVGSVVSPSAIKPTISGIFDERHEPMLDMYGGSIDSIGTGKRITFKVQTANVDGLRHGDEIVITGNNYSIVGINAIGDGKITELVLKESGV